MQYSNNGAYRGGNRNTNSGYVLTKPKIKDIIYYNLGNTVSDIVFIEYEAVDYLRHICPASLRVELIPRLGFTDFAAWQCQLCGKVIVGI